MTDPDKPTRCMVWQERERLRLKFEEDQRRVERQRTLVVMLPAGPASERLKMTMLARARDLLDRGDCDRADELLEWLPSRDAEALLAEVFPPEEEVGAG